MSGGFLRAKTPSKCAPRKHSCQTVSEMLLRLNRKLLYISSLTGFTICFCGVQYLVRGGGHPSRCPLGSCVRRTIQWQVLNPKPYAPNPESQPQGPGSRERGGGSPMASAGNRAARCRKHHCQTVREMLMRLDPKGTTSPNPCTLHVQP